MVRVKKRSATEQLGFPGLVLGTLSLLLASCTIKPVGEIVTPGTDGGTPRGTAVPMSTVPPSSPTLTSVQTVTVLDEQPPEPAPVGEYIVQAGDTLLGLASEWGVPMAAIQRANGMGDSTVVKVGLPLTIPSSEGWEGASRFWVLHIVKEGETLSHIARRYDLTIARLKEVNGLGESDTIRVGQDLIIPLDGPDVTRVPIPTATPDPPTATPRPTITATAVVTGTSTNANTAASVVSEVTSAPTESEVEAAEPAALPSDLVDWPREVFRLINEIRAREGLPPYTYNDALAGAAQAHANDCAGRAWCSHTGSDGSDIKLRVRRVGYEGAGWAECWAQRQSPQDAVAIWMDEEPPNDPHRRTLLHTWLTEIGIGVAEAAWGHYFIADFGRP